MIGSTDLEESRDSFGSRNEDGSSQKPDKVMSQDVSMAGEGDKNNPGSQETASPSRVPGSDGDGTNKTPSAKMKRLVLDSSSDEEDTVISRRHTKNKEESDEEDLSLSIRKTPKSRRRAVLEDSDGEDSMPATGEGSSVQQSTADGGMSDSSDGEDGESDRGLKRLGSKKKRIVMDDSSDEDELPKSSPGTKAKDAVRHKSGQMNGLADSSDDEDMVEETKDATRVDRDRSKPETETKMSKDGKKKRPVLDSSSDEEVEEMQLNKMNSDLFDDEQNDNSDQSEDRDSERDEQEEDRPNKSTKGKGRKKQEKPPRPKRLSKAEQHLMHSETQRMTRESELNLPYLKPPPKTIDDFFKPKPKQGPLKAVRGIASLLRRPVAQQLAVRKTTSLPTRPAEKPSTTTQTPSQVKVAAPQTATKADVFLQDELDELPDIVDNSNEKDDKDLPNNSASQNEPVDSDLIAGNTKSCEEHISENNVEMQEDVEATQGTSEGVTQDSGVETDAAMSAQTSAPLPTDISDDVTSAQPSEQSQTTTTTVEQSEPVQGEQAEKEELKLTMPPPCLSGDPDSFIDLEDSGVSSSDKPRKKGSMVDLLDRFMKHSQASKKRAKKHQQQISIVKKEMTAEGKEELKQETLTVTVEEGEEPAKDLAPGARLLKLKESLQAKMRVRRAQEREKRQQMYQLDNEEGFGEEEEELTDEEDTDEEEQDEGEEAYLGQGILDLEAEEDGDEEEEEADNDTILTDELPASTSLKPVKLCPGDSETDSSNVDFKTPAKFARPAHPFSAGSDKTMDLFDSTTSESNMTTPGNSNSNHSVKSKQDSTKGLQVTPTGNSKPGQGKGFFSFSAIKQKKGLIRHESQGFQYDDSDLSQDGSGRDSKGQANISSGDLNTSMDLGASIPSHQPEKTVGLSREDTAPDLFAPFSKFKSGEELNSGQKSSTKLSLLTLPIEDSQDLYHSSQSPQPGQRLVSTQSFHFSLESDSQQSQLLDSDGFLKAADEKRPPKRQLLLPDDDNAMDTNMEELLELCSGKFTGNTQSPGGSQRDRRELDGSRGFAPDSFKARLPIKETQDDMDELLGLCSGTFTDSTQPRAQTSQGRKRALNESQDGGSMSLRMMSDDELEEKEEKEEEKEEERTGRKYFSDGEEERDEAEDEADCEEEEDDDEKENDLEDKSNEELNFHRHFKGFTYKTKRKIRGEFVEQEAELSGSEEGSGDEAEGSDLDEYEHDTDPEDLPSDEEELQKQVHRLHMKSMLDEDKRKLRLYQEAYLEDGDLHSDSRRRRRFRWTNIDENSQTDLFTLNSDGEQEGEEGEGEDDSQWRKARFQREQWLREKQESQHDSDEDKLDENSQFVKTAKKALSKMKKPTLPLSPSKENQAKKNNSSAVSPGKPATLAMRYRYGSFLKKDKASLERLTSGKVVDPNGPRHSKSFLFKRVSPDKPKPATKRPQVHRSMSQVVTPSAKRPRLDRSQSEDSNSVFNILKY